MSLALLAIVGLVILVITIPLLVYHFLIFPNIDGVLQDLRWYNYDDQSQHFIYWFFFWGVAFGSAVGTKGLVKNT